MEYSAFRDYCKAENSEEEDVNRDLQSRLYAEVYYTSNDAGNKDTKSNIKLETYTDHQNLYNDASTSKVSGPKDYFINSNTDKNYKNTCLVNDSANSSIYIKDDDKSHIKPTCVANKIELPCKDTSKKINSNVFCAQALKYCKDNIEDSMNKKELRMCRNLKSAENYSDGHETYKIQDTKSQIEEENKEQLKTVQSLNYEKTSDHLSHLNCGAHYADNSINKNHGVARTETNVNNAYGNIFKKYEFSKLFINKLYLEKYEMLEKKLHGIEADRERNFQSEEYMTTDVKEDNRNCQQEMSDNNVKSANHPESNTKYEILRKRAKVQNRSHYVTNVTILASETSSDSEVSILEVPIPPKPQPPIINLKDTDESSGPSSTDSDTDQEHSFNRKEKNDLSVTMEKTTFMNDRDSNSKTLDINIADDTTIREDIMLNCMEIQRATSSIKEIMDTSKTIRPAQYSDNDKSYCEKQQSTLENEIYNKCFNEHTYGKYNMPIVNLPSKTINYSNAVYERDKNVSINFTEDIMVSNFINTNETIQNRKRRHENAIEPSTSAKHGRYSGNDSKPSKLDPQQYNENKINQESKQETFDMQRIQSNMSKDPRLWVILDEDLMPNLRKQQRYWNMKCNNCHQSGHLRHKCPEPYKPIRCHMCGTQGHTETRCPQKMCLTCGKKQRLFRQTCESCRILYCDMCKATGHKSTECPDLWRRFHQTTQMTEINIPENLSEVMKPTDLLYCCNCSRRGHDSSTCHEYRWSQHFPTPAFVSNYRDGPACEVAHCGNKTNDVIPLTKLKEKEMSVFPKDVDDLDSNCVIYSYGSFHTNLANGREINRKLVIDKVYMAHITNLVNGHIYPCFLDELMQKINFEIKIFYNDSKQLMIRVRSMSETCCFILKIFVFWLKLEDSEKHLTIRTEFPCKTKVLMKLLEKKVKELNTIVEDPHDICSKLKHLKTTIQNPSISTTKKIIQLQENLIKVYHAKPKFTGMANRLRRFVKLLGKSSREHIDIGLYFDIVVTYNKIFVPRTLNNNELEQFLKKYDNVNGKKTKRKVNTKVNTKMKPNRELGSAYLKFIEKLRSNTARTTKVAKRNIQNSDSYSSNNIDKQKIVVPPTTLTSVEYVSATSIGPDIEIVTQNTDPVSNETLDLGNTTTKPPDVDRIECIELPCNKDISNSNKTTNADNSKLTTLSNVITLEKSIDSNVPANQSNNNHLPSVSSAQMKNSKNNIGKNLETVNNNTGTTEISNLEKVNTVDLESDVPKKKKGKKTKKAKLELHNISDVIEIDTEEIDTSMRDQVNHIISVALEFNVPYMNKAVEEIKKKLNDKTIKQEHIDTLQRLINLENDHRKYVSSFCNYLQ